MFNLSWQYHVKEKLMKLLLIYIEIYRRLSKNWYTCIQYKNECLLFGDAVFACDNNPFLSLLHITILYCCCKTLNCFMR